MVTALIIGLCASLLGAFVTGGFALARQNNQNAFDEAENEKDREQKAELQREQEIADYESQLALQQQQQEYDTYMSNTEYQRQVADMKAAGLNVGAIGGGTGTSAAGLTNPASSVAKTDATNPLTGKQSAAGAPTTALVLEGIIKTALDNPKQMYNNIGYMAKVESSSAKQQLRNYIEDYKKENEA